MQNLKPINPVFIAEIKTQSPFGFRSEYSFSELMTCAIEHGDWISVHDNALWGGDFELISFVRKFTNKPILAKGLHSTEDDIIRAIDHGATYVLVVDRLPMTRTTFNKCIIEHSNFEIVKAEAHVFPDTKFCCNSRNLFTGDIKVKNELQDYLDLNVWTCQASNIRSPNDVNPDVNAFIVGSNLIDFCKEYKKVVDNRPLL